MIAIALGALVGLVLGLTGAGGAAIAVPLLMWGLGWTLPQAAPVALLAVSGSAAFGTLTAWDRTYVRYRAALLMAATGLLTAPLGLWAADRLPLSWLSGLFAAVLVLVALRLWRQSRRAQAPRAPDPELVGEDVPARGPWGRLNPQSGRLVWDRRCFSAVGGTGLVTGFLSGLLGVGGGFVIVPALRALTELSMHSAVATSLMAVALTSASTVLLALLHGRDFPLLVALPFVLGAVLGMSAGRWLAPRLPAALLQRGFAVLLLGVAIGMALHAGT